MDVNEEIVIQYIKLIKKWFYMTDISFEVPHNYSNIDLLAYDPGNNKYYDIEVKYRSAFSLTLKNMNENAEFLKFVSQLLRPERTKKIKEIIGSNKHSKVFVTTESLFGKSESKRQQVKNSFIDEIQKQGYDCEIWYFDKITNELFEKVDVKGKYDTELIQTIRLIKTHVKIKTENK